MPLILRMKATIDGIEVDDNLEAAFEYCQNKLEPQLLTNLIKEYLPLFQKRTYFCTCSNEYITLKHGNVLDFRNSQGNVLASVHLLIQLNKRQVSLEFPLDFP